MSWLTNLIPKKDEYSNSDSPKKEKNNLYISVESTRVCFLLMDENQNPNKILSWEEIALGPIEDLDIGQPVRDIFGTLLKVFTSHKEKFTGVENISVSLPAEGVFFKNVEVPKMADPDMQKLILGEIKKTLPVDFSQVLFAQNDIGEKHDKMKSFFCVGIQKNLFENYKNLFAKFNLNPYFEIEVFSLARIARRDNNQKLIVQIGRLNSFLIFLEGQIIQEVKMLDLGENQINQKVLKDLNIAFKDTELLKKSVEKLEDNGRMGAKVMDEYIKDLNTKIAKAISLHILEYEKKMTVEIKEVTISGTVVSNKIRKTILDEFDAELKVDFVNEENFGQFVADNFSLDELKRYTQCFGLALRNK
jgi:Tfp pilus assembly PilM family ATPase